MVITATVLCSSTATHRRHRKIAKTCTPLRFAIEKHTALRIQQCPSRIASNRSSVVAANGGMCYVYTMFSQKQGLRVSAVFAVARCPSVCPSVPLVYCIQTAEDIVKLISRPCSLIILVFWPRTPVFNSKGNPFSRGAKYTGMGKFCDFRLKSPFISETVCGRSSGRQTNWATVDWATTSGRLGDTSRVIWATRYRNFLNAIYLQCSPKK